MPIEINEIGPTIQQGVIQHPVQRDTQAAGTRPRRSMPPHEHTTDSEST